MRKTVAIIALALMTLGLGASAAPAGATGKEGPVEVRQECGGTNIYILGTPVFNYFWCPPDK